LFAGEWLCFDAGDLWPGPAFHITFITIDQGKRPMRQTISYWIPAAFCAFISLIALFGSSSSASEPLLSLS
jgi:hypothetical protein